MIFIMRKKNLDLFSRDLEKRLQKFVERLIRDEKYLLCGVFKRIKVVLIIKIKLKLSKFK